METTLTKGKQSNYQISVVANTEDIERAKKKTLQGFQKNIKEPGFRKGRVPLDIIEKRIDPIFLETGILEELVHRGVKNIINEHKEIKFIGNIYDLNKEEEDEKIIITFKLDVYPEVEMKDEKRKKIKLDKIDDKATDKEIEETLLNLRKQYASYEPTETITENSVFKIQFIITDKDSKEIDKGSVFLGKEEIEKFNFIKKNFLGKKNKESFTLPYDEKKLPPMLYKRKEGNAKNITFTIKDVREVILPDFSPENIKKFFGNEEVKNEKDLRKKIKTLIEKQKYEASLMQTIDKMLNQADSSFAITIPKTLIEEEKKTRIKSLKERLGGDNGFKQYMEKIGEEQTKKMMEDIENAAKSSLKKFFLLKTIGEQLGIENLDRNTPLSVEEKVYEKMNQKR